jgi:hypothetical protein
MVQLMTTAPSARVSALLVALTTAHRVVLASVVLDIVHAALSR